MPLTGIAHRLALGCCGCGFESAAVAVGADPEHPDETYGRRCWADPARWDTPRPPHIHLDGRDCGQECES